MSTHNPYYGIKPLLIISLICGAIVYLRDRAFDERSNSATKNAPWIQVPESNTSFLPIDLSDGTKCVALKVQEQVAITCNWSTTQTP